MTSRAGFLEKKNSMLFTNISFQLIYTSIRVSYQYKQTIFVKIKIEKKNVIIIIIELNIEILVVEVDMRSYDIPNGSS